MTLDRINGLANIAQFAIPAAIVNGRPTLNQRPISSTGTRVPRTTRVRRMEELA